MSSHKFISKTYKEQMKRHKRGNMCLQEKKSKHTSHQISEIETLKYYFTYLDKTLKQYKLISVDEIL